MNRQDYIKEMKAAIIEEYGEIIKDSEDTREEIAEKVNELAWVDDSVTGNGSGSFTFDRAKAQENIEGAEDVIREMVEYFGIDKETVCDKFLEEDWEWFDVSIRCYLLGEAIDEALKELGK